MDAPAESGLWAPRFLETHSIEQPGEAGPAMTPIARNRHGLKMTQDEHLIYKFPKGWFATFRQLFEQKEEIRVGARRAIKAFTCKDDY